jgi:hypothetical protein
MPSRALSPLHQAASQPTLHTEPGRPRRILVLLPAGSWCAVSLERVAHSDGLLGLGLSGEQAGEAWGMGGGVNVHSAPDLAVEQRRRPHTLPTAAPPRRPAAGPPRRPHLHPVLPPCVPGRHRRLHPVAQPGVAAAADPHGLCGLCRVHAGRPAGETCLGCQNSSPPATRPLNPAAPLNPDSWTPPSSATTTPTAPRAPTPSCC